MKPTMIKIPLISLLLTMGIACSENPDEMVTVPAGWFWQGCNPAVDSCYQQTDSILDTPGFENELPYRRLNIPAFEIDMHEVTVDDYDQCINEGGCTPPGTHDARCNWGVSGREQHPVNCVDWNQAWMFCGWSGKRLCSESEWEKAARGQEGFRYPWGNELPTCELAVMNGCGLNTITSPVGSKKRGASPYGALDMSGNVLEWVEDDWHDNYDGAPEDGSAWINNPRNYYRVVRGGSVYDTHSRENFLRSSERFWEAAIEPFLDYELGFRCCRSK